MYWLKIRLERFKPNKKQHDSACFNKETVSGEVVIPDSTAYSAILAVCSVCWQSSLSLCEMN